MKEQIAYRKRLDNGVVIEEAILEDAPAIVDLTAAGQQAYVNIKPDLTEEVIRQYVASEAFRKRILRKMRKAIKSRRALVLVARSGDEIVGFAKAEVKGFRKRRHLNSGNYVSRRGEGIGSELTRPRIIWHGPVPIFLFVVPGTDAEGFHRSFGFEPTGVETAVPYGEGHVLPLIEMKRAAQNKTPAFTQRK